MALMDFTGSQFIEWVDDSSDTIVYRLPVAAK
jgi:hypothetical protein